MFIVSSQGYLNILPSVMSNYCKYNLLEISRLLSHADLHTIELSRTFHQVKNFFCKLLKCSRTLCEFIYTYIYIYMYRLTYVVVEVVVMVGATTVLKAIPKENYCGRLLISRNFGDSSEIVLVVS